MKFDYLKLQLMKIRLLGLCISSVLISFILTACDDNSNSNIGKFMSDSINSDSAYQKADFEKYWPGQPALFKLRENLVLAIPPQFQKFWVQGNRVTRASTFSQNVPQVDSIGFQMFLPNFSGYTSDNFLQEFDEDQIQVISIRVGDPKQSEPGAPGIFTKNVLGRFIGANLIDPNNYVNKYGLRCYRFRYLDSDKNADLSDECVGPRGKHDKEQLLLDVLVPPYQSYVKFPIMQATYYSESYGGVEITWRAHVKHLAKWREIDNQIWTYIEAWNIGSHLEKN